MKTQKRQTTEPKKGRYRANCNRQNKGFWVDKEIYRNFRDAYLAEDLSMSQALETFMINELKKRNIHVDSAPLNSKPRY